MDDFAATSSSRPMTRNEQGAWDVLCHLLESASQLCAAQSKTTYHHDGDIVGADPRFAQLKMELDEAYADHVPAEDEQAQLPGVVPS